MDLSRQVCATQANAEIVAVAVVLFIIIIIIMVIIIVIYLFIRWTATSTTGGTWDQIFSIWNPNYDTFTAHVEVQLVATGTTDGFPKYPPRSITFLGCCRHPFRHFLTGSASLLGTLPKKEILTLAAKIEMT